MAISSIRIAGFKSLFDDQAIRIAPITIFAGANSAGKSSASQPLLLLKQTIESQFDPGAILLYGPNVQFTSYEQVLSRTSISTQQHDFSIEFFDTEGWSFTAKYHIQKGSVQSLSVTIKTGNDAVTYSVGSELSNESLSGFIPKTEFIKQLIKQYEAQKVTSMRWRGTQGRCFPDLTLHVQYPSSNFYVTSQSLPYTSKLRNFLSNIIHIRGLRANPERSYFATARARSGFPGAFEDYVASILMDWQKSKNDNLTKLGGDLRDLDLTWKVRAVPIKDTHAEIRVGRLQLPAQGGANDLVSLADVGLGVSQILPFLVALRVAKSGQVVFVEQPEIHLHPNAQFRLADTIARAAKRGVRVWIETHSAILIRGIQTEIAASRLRSEAVALNWFQRDRSTGATKVVATTPDGFGRLGDWPADFDEIAMRADKTYLDTVARARRDETER